VAEGSSLPMNLSFGVPALAGPDRLKAELQAAGERLWFFTASFGCSLSWGRGSGETRRPHAELHNKL